jgi:hypothetical protein
MNTSFKTVFIQKMDLICVLFKEIQKSDIFTPKLGPRTFFVFLELCPADRKKQRSNGWQRQSIHYQCLMSDLTCDMFWVILYCGNLLWHSELCQNFIPNFSILAFGLELGLQINLQICGFYEGLSPTPLPITSTWFVSHCDLDSLCIIMYLTQSTIIDINP